MIIIWINDLVLTLDHQYGYSRNYNENSQNWHDPLNNVMSFLHLFVKPNQLHYNYNNIIPILTTLQLQ